MTIREQVGTILYDLCEDTGITEMDDGDFEVQLNDCPVFVRAYESPPAISLYREVAEDVQLSEALTARLHDENARYRVDRVFWEDGSLFPRADIPSAPVVPEQLQHVLENFEAEVQAFRECLADWQE